MYSLNTDDLVDVEVSNNLVKIQKKIEKENKKKENPKINPKTIFGSSYKEPIIKKKKNKK